MAVTFYEISIPQNETVVQYIYRSFPYFFDYRQKCPVSDAISGIFCRRATGSDRMLRPDGV